MNASLQRITAAFIALVAWGGLAIQLQASIALSGSLGGALWAMSRYFTVLSNLALALIMGGAAVGNRAATRPAVLGGITITMLLVGVVYGLLLNGLLELSGGARLADTILHKVTPVFISLWWALFAPKKGLRYGHAWMWAVPPAAYLGYALWRGAREGVYAYPFISVTELGWSHVLLNACAIAAGFLLAGFAMVWISRQIARAG